MVGQAAVECAVGCGDRGASSTWTKKPNKFQVDLGRIMMESADGCQINLLISKVPETLKIVRHQGLCSVDGWNSFPQANEYI